MSDTLSAVRRPVLYVGVAGDAPRSPPARIGLGDVDRVELGRGEARLIKRAVNAGDRVVTLALPDPRMSTRHARLSRSDAGWVVEDLDSKNGTLVGLDRIKRQALGDGEVILVGHTALLFRVEGGDAPDLETAPAAIGGTLVTLSSLLAERYRALIDAAGARMPIEVVGPPGSERELVARAVHARSGRRGSFQVVSCGQLPPGDDRGAVIPSADGGTLFLDDVDLLPYAAQVALERALVEGAVVGGTPVDLRIVSGTQRDLDAEVEAGQLSSELRALIAGHQITLPPLRKRREDLAHLVAGLLERHAPERAITLSADAVATLYAHDWPLDVHELERTLIAALAVATERIELEHLPTSVGSTEPVDQPIYRPVTPEERALRDELVATLARQGGDIIATAAELGRDPRTVRGWMKRLGIRRDG